MFSLTPFLLSLYPSQSSLLWLTYPFHWVPPGAPWLSTLTDVVRIHLSSISQHYWWRAWYQFANWATFYWKGKSRWTLEYTQGLLQPLSPGKDTAKWTVKLGDRPYSGGEGSEHAQADCWQCGACSVFWNQITSWGKITCLSQLCSSRGSCDGDISTQVTVVSDDCTGLYLHWLSSAALQATQDMSQEISGLANRWALHMIEHHHHETCSLSFIHFQTLSYVLFHICYDLPENLPDECFATWVFTHRITCVFTQLLLLSHHRGRVHYQFLEARRAERGALLLVRDQLGHGQLGASVRRQLRLAPRGPRSCAKGMYQGLSVFAGAGDRVAPDWLLVSFKGPWRRAAQIGLRRREHAV